MSSRLDKTQPIIHHVLRHLPLPRRPPPAGVEHVASKPLFVGISGPQGIGKTTLTKELVATLSGAPHNLRVLAFATDDLYLPFKEQEALKWSDPDNKLIEFRGLPGTHDISLGASTFQAICEANRQVHSGSEHQQVVVPIPSYDKSLHAGRGDQIPRDQWLQVKAPFDVVLFEGWSLGFRSVHNSELLFEMYQQRSTFPPYYLAKHPFSSLETINRSLEEYERQWYSYLDVFVHLSAPNLATVFKWRAEQERDLWAMKGSGMSVDQIRDFVSRFMPAYEIYLEKLKVENVFREEEEEDNNIAPTLSTESLSVGRHLRLDLDEERDLIQVTLVE
ncbi:hypothetical protein BGZ65_001882 [Modicella reniformis]|uniref:P-loop containing nucleoside triphosphate hydrolase protein n=1 Tax=Modicella reniformis TaxID=1440133 RepID=A0A9P6ING2_9FUNG|nr:hypothetical protein BGZ65_001882 [Modicella reniformis]